MPLWGVGGPDTNAVFAVGVAGLLDNVDNTSAEILAALAHLSISYPIELVLVLLRGGIPLAHAKRLPGAIFLDRELEEVVNGLDLGLELGQERLVAEAPVTEDGGAVGTLGAGDRDSMRNADGRWCADVGDDLFCGLRGHGCGCCGWGSLARSAANVRLAHGPGSFGEAMPGARAQGAELTKTSDAEGQKKKRRRVSSNKPDGQDGKFKTDDKLARRLWTAEEKQRGKGRGPAIGSFDADASQVVDWSCAQIGHEVRGTTRTSTGRGYGDAMGCLGSSTATGPLSGVVREKRGVGADGMPTLRDRHAKVISGVSSGL